ncbi:MAG: hypothetical protein MZW92_02695 [Comamonadaceae bacterium]|nr:hypothetical protein [Comamonadaceae bacterium]
MITTSSSCNSKVKRGLVDSKYNERRKECDAALAILRKKTDVADLRSPRPRQVFDTASRRPDGRPSSTAARRHAVYENARTKGSRRTAARRATSAGLRRRDERLARFAARRLRGLHAPNSTDSSQSPVNAARSAPA